MGTAAQPARHVGRRATAERAPALPPAALFELVKEQGPGLARTCPSPLRPAADGRSYSLVELDDDLEVWVIRWPSGGALELHDHGGSAGAFVVVEGHLLERYVTGEGAAGVRRVQPGHGAAFGPTYIHDVTNAGSELAVSVHAYSPPMPGMRFYEFSNGGELTSIRWEDRSHRSWHP